MIFLVLKLGIHFWCTLKERHLLQRKIISEWSHSSERAWESITTKRQWPHQNNGGVFKILPQKRTSCIHFILSFLITLWGLTHHTGHPMDVQCDPRWTKSDEQLFCVWCFTIFSTVFVFLDSLVHLWEPLVMDWNNIGAHSMPSFSILSTN